MGTAKLIESLKVSNPEVFHDPIVHSLLMQLLKGREVHEVLGEIFTLFASQHNEFNKLKFKLIEKGIKL